MKKAVYPGSFDPITNGHLDIARRAAKVFDEVIILIADNPSKSSKFSIEERKEMIQEAVKDLPNVSVDYTNGLTVRYAKEHGIQTLVRGLRAVTDFEYEFKLNASNEFIDSSIDTVFFMSTKDNDFISSSYIDELYKNNIDISPLVPTSVVEMYKKKMSR